MKYLDFYTHFSKKCTASIVNLSDIKNAFPRFNTVQLNQWQQKQYIKKLRREQYIFLNEKLDINLISHDIKKSYISQESALSLQGVIPEAVFTITAITTERPEEIRVLDNTISYKNIKPALFTGYKMTNSSICHHRQFAIATVEKALFDLVYFRSDLSQDIDFDSLRINLPSFDPHIFNRYLSLIKQPSRHKRLQSFLSYLKKEHLC